MCVIRSLNGMDYDTNISVTKIKIKILNLLNYFIIYYDSGIGICTNIVNCYLGIYYNMIIAYSLLFLFLSLRANLPWEKCLSEWSSPSKFFKTKYIKMIKN